jgi:hypothetical protein
LLWERKKSKSAGDIHLEIQIERFLRAKRGKNIVVNGNSHFEVTNERNIAKASILGTFSLQTS